MQNKSRDERVFETLVGWKHWNVRATHFQMAFISTPEGEAAATTLDSVGMPTVVMPLMPRFRGV